MRPPPTGPTRVHPTPPSSWQAPAGLFLAGLLVHTLWALTIPGPLDWDPAYYLDVARSIASGEGAVTHAIWHLAGPALPLPQPADLHWIPLPSRALVPGVGLLGDVGAQATSVVLAAGWGPLAWLAARTLPIKHQDALFAGVLAVLGDGWVRFSATTDSLALYGLVGGPALVLGARKHCGYAVLAVALAALTRGAGFLLAPCVGLALWPRWRWSVAATVAGPLAAGGWWLRNAALAGEDAWALRRTTAGALHIHDLLYGRTLSPYLAERFEAAVDVLGSAPNIALLVGVGVGTLLAAAGAVLHRGAPLVWGAAACTVGIPFSRHFQPPASRLRAPSFAAEPP